MANIVDGQKRPVVVVLDTRKGIGIEGIPGQATTIVKVNREPGRLGLESNSGKPWWMRR